jgi:glutathione peroxidase
MEWKKDRLSSIVVDSVLVNEVLVTENINLQVIRSGGMAMSIYSFSAKRLDGTLVSLSDFQGQVFLIVNTASECGFTPQYKGLQELYDQYKDRGFTVLAFPCNQFGGQEPGDSDEIQAFCEKNYGVTFPVFEKVDVKGKESHPLFQYLVKEAPGFLFEDIKWNFTKFLIDREGNVVKRYAPTTKPEELSQEIEKYL